MHRFIATCAVALALAGCASKGMDQAQCRTADWRAIGFEDGRQGRAASALGGRRRDCAEHGVTPDFAAYMAGHRSGIAQFCRPANGYRLGVSGYRYGGVCPARLEPAFLAAHADGYGLYQRGATVDRLKHRLERKRSRSDSLERSIADKTASLISPATPPARRLSLGVELKQLTAERIDTEHEIGRLEHDLARARRDYRNYRERLARR